MSGSLVLHLAGLQRWVYVKERQGKKRLSRDELTGHLSVHPCICVSSHLMGVSAASEAGREPIMD